MNYDRGGAFFDKKVDNEKYKKDVENEPVTALQRIDHFTWYEIHPSQRDSRC